MSDAAALRKGLFSELGLTTQLVSREANDLEALNRFRHMVSLLERQQRGGYWITNGRGEKVGVALSRAEFELLNAVLALLTNPVELQTILEQSKEAKEGSFEGALSFIEVFPER